MSNQREFLSYSSESPTPVATVNAIIGFFSRII